MADWGTKGVSNEDYSRKYNPDHGIDHKEAAKRQRKKAMLHGRVRPIGRETKVCGHCKQPTEYKEDIEQKSFVCIRCGKTPPRLCVDVHFSGRRYRIYSDRQGDALDSYERAFKLLSKISEEINDKTFDPSRYVESEQSAFRLELLIEKWMLDKQRELALDKISPSYLRAIRSHVDNHIVPFFKGRDVREIRTRAVKDFYYQLPTNLSPKTHRNILGDVENFFNCLLEDEVIEAKPMFPSIEYEGPEIKWCNRAIQDAILQSIPEQHRGIFYFLTRQGCRPGEALALQWHDLDLKDEVLTIRRTFSDRRLREKPKNKKVRPRLLHPDNAEMLRAMPKALPGAYVFVNPDTGKPYIADKINHLWNDAVKVTGVNLTLYGGTRHSVASMASSGGVDLNVIKKVLGHSDIRMTQKYAHVDMLAQREVFAVADLPSKANRLQTVCKAKTCRKKEVKTGC